MRIRGRLRVGLVSLLGVALLASGACGRKTDVRPPHLVGPSPVTGLSAENRGEGISIAWDRPTRYADGSQMLDLNGFRIERRRPCCGFNRLAEVPVEDRTRFRQAKRFRYIDEWVEPGELYSYRVIAVTVDKYESVPSEPVQIQRRVELEGE